MVWNFWSSSMCLLSAGIIGVWHHDYYPLQNLGLIFTYSHDISHFVYIFKPIDFVYNYDTSIFSKRVKK